MVKVVGQPGRRLQQTRRQIAAGIASGAFAILAIAPPASAQESTDTRQKCLTNHELAQVRRMDSDLLAAQSHLRECAEAACPAFIRGDCVRWLDEVHGAIPTVSLIASSENGDESNVRVYVDDTLITEKLDGRPIELNPGAYRFRFEREPAEPITKQVILREGEKNRVVSVQFDLRPDPPPVVAAPTPSPPPPAPPAVEDYRPVPTLAFVLGAVAVAGGATAAILGVSARTARDDAKSSCAPLCSDSEVASIRARAIGSDVSTGVSIAAAAGATYLFLTRPVRQRDSRPIRVSLVPLPAGGLIGIDGGFE